MLSVSQLFIYPVKSLGGIPVASATLTDRGFKNDRRWMLIDMDHRFLSQREIAAMALLQCSIDDDYLTITHKVTNDRFVFDMRIHRPNQINATVWDDTCKVYEVSKHASDWFSDTLHLPCRLVYMPDESLRPVDPHYAINQEVTSLSDGYPLLTISQESLDDLNTRLDEKIPMDRFRPGIVFTGGHPYQEDDMKHFRINGIDFFGVKPCARCIVTTTDQDTAIRSNEPLRTLRTYRMTDNKVMFGMNLLYSGSGTISVGDKIEVL